MPALINPHFTRNITAGWSSSLYGGTGSSTEVPGKFSVAINGRTYLVAENANELYRDHFHVESLDIIRQQADNSNQPSEATITPEGLWRRAGEDWSHGAGQTHRDQPDSDPVRFRSSKGIDVWTRYKATLLPDTDGKLTSSNTNFALMPAGSRLYLVDGANLKYTTDILTDTPSWSTVSATPAETASFLASDGTNVWVVYTGANGIYSTTTSTSAAAAYVTSPVNGPIAYVKGRLMAAKDNAIYNVIAGGALPTALFSQGNTAFKWIGFAEGAGQIYAAGYAGDKSIIYRTAVKTDGTALDAPVVAGELPTGEIVRSIQGYLGYIVIGSDLGIRFSQPNANGDLIIGSLIRTGTPISSPVRCLTAADRFVWFGWSMYDSTSTGLGRLDLSVFTAPLTPAYASDLMTDGGNDVVALATFQAIQVFGVAGIGIFAATPSVAVPAGHIDSGDISYGIPDHKVAMFLDINSAPLVGSITAEYSADGASFGSAGVVEGDGITSLSMSTNQSRGHSHETRIILSRDPDTFASPTLTRWTLRTYPAPSVGFRHSVPIMLHEEVHIDGSPVYYNVTEERERFRQLTNTRALVAYQEGRNTHTVFVDGINFIHHHRTRNGEDWNGTMIVSMKELPA